MENRGSKSGERRGGRAKGTPNRATAAKAAEVAASGLTPLDYMLRVMRDEDAPVERRDEMAKAAASYVHPRLAQVETHNETEISVISAEPMSEAEWAETHGAQLAKAPVN